MTIDDKITKVIKGAHNMQYLFPDANTYTITLIDEGRHIDIKLTRQELENNGPELHPLVKQRLVEKGVHEDAFGLPGV